MNEKYSISEEQKKYFAGIYLLEYMINEPTAFALLLERNDADLEPVFEYLLINNWIEIQENSRYVANSNGRQELKKFLQRYTEFLHLFDVYCAVDLEEGAFAFNEYFEFENIEDWNDFLAQEHWEDLRIAVADFKGINPVEIVFMSFIQEKRFGRDDTGWQFDLLLGSVWDEILEICNSSIQIEQLGYESEEEDISGYDVIEDIIEQGTELMSALHQNEAQFDDDFGRAKHNQKDASFHPIVDAVEADEFDQEDYQRYENPRYRSRYW